MSDVEAATGVVTGDVLQWSGSTWAHVAATSIGATTLEALTDTTITSAASGDFLRYNGTAWVDSAIQNGDISSTMVTQHQGDLSDYSVSSY